MKIVPPLERRTVLCVVIAALVPGFALTHTLVNRYKHGRLELAQEWASTGERDLQAGEAEAAVLAFETALSYTPERDDYRLRLAEALIAAKRPNEAVARLEVIVTNEPGDGKANLELARLAAARRDITRVVHYYHDAIDGAWHTGAPTARRQARLELARFLLANGQRTQAQGELIALIDDLPPDSALVTDIGELLAQAGAPNRALDLFRRALSLDRHNSRAAQRAGQLEFSAGQYRLAQRDLRLARAGGPLDTDGRDMLDISTQVLDLDPYTRGIPSRERARRALAALQVARTRFARCQAAAPQHPPAPVPPAAGGTPAAPPVPVPAGNPVLSDLAARLDAHKNLRQRTLEHDADAVDDTMTLVFDVERLPESLCGPATPDDRALLILAGQRNGRAQ